jgi:AcrR family transcriptional regulator
MNRSTDDPRVRRTLQLARHALFALLSERRYDDIRVADIIERAGVARSTFYEHFEGKDDAVVKCMQFLLEVLARSVGPADNEPELRRTLEHFWEQRHLARPLFLGRPRVRIARALADLIVAQLSAMPGTPCLAPRLVAMQLSEGTLALLAGWLVGAAPASSEALAAMVRDSAQASVQLLFEGSGAVTR